MKPKNVGVPRPHACLRLGFADAEVARYFAVVAGATAVPIPPEHESHPFPPDGSGVTNLPDRHPIVSGALLADFGGEDSRSSVPHEVAADVAGKSCWGVWCRRGADRLVSCAGVVGVEGLLSEHVQLERYRLLLAAVSVVKDKRLTKNDHHRGWGQSQGESSPVTCPHRCMYNIPLETPLQILPWW